MKYHIEKISIVNAVSLTAFAGGILLFLLGILIALSSNSDIPRFFGDSAPDSSIWMLVGGDIATILGLVGLLRKSKDE